MFLEEPCTPERIEAIALSQYIEKLGHQLAAQDLEDAVSDDFLVRSPSPPPEYDKQGRRTNTREQRLRSALEIERTLAVRKALELIPDYVPPSDFNRLARLTEKYLIPVREYPQINFVGLLLGPRGNALRRMESESGARISIRGRGSVKEGSRSATTQAGQDEDLHCVVSATSHESLKKAFDCIKGVVDTATQTPEHHNDFKRLQLRELAELNGTLRDYENQLCGFCGEPGHRKFACPRREAVLKEAVCRRCGEQGHMIRDCASKNAPAGLQDFLKDLDNDVESMPISQEVLPDDPQISGIKAAQAAKTEEPQGKETPPFLTDFISRTNPAQLPVVAPGTTTGPPGVDLFNPGKVPEAPPGFIPMYPQQPKAPPGAEIPSKSSPLGLHYIGSPSASLPKAPKPPPPSAWKPPGTSP